MSLPWLTEIDKFVTHARQVGIIAENNGRVSLTRFCECQIDTILKCDVSNLTILSKPIYGKNYKCVYTQKGEGINPFASKLFNSTILGNCVVYVQDEDIDMSTLQHLVDGLKVT